MATRKNTVQKRDLACVRIGFHEYLIDADKAMQVIKLFRESCQCEMRYVGGTGYQYVVGKKPELEMTLVEPGDVVMPGDRGRPLAIESE